MAHSYFCITNQFSKKMLSKTVVNRIFTKTFGCRLMTIRQCSSKEPSDFESDIVHRDDSGFITIPEYPTRIDEPLEKRRQRLLYQSRKRGMLENDLLLSTFASKYLKGMTEQQIILYDKLINKPSNDWDIYNWAIGSKPTPTEYENEIMDLFRRHVKNDLKEKRLRMPDLE